MPGPLPNYDSDSETIDELYDENGLYRNPTLGEMRLICIRARWRSLCEKLLGVWYDLDTICLRAAVSLRRVQ